MKQILLTTVLFFLVSLRDGTSRETFDFDECMRYAVENSPSVKSKFIHQIRIRRNGMPL